MNAHQIGKARINLEHAGTPQDRESMRASYVRTLKNDIERLEQEMKSASADFRRTLSSWTTEDVLCSVIPSKVIGQVQTGQLYWFTGLIACSGEMGLAAWIFYNLGIRWWFGPIVAVIITFVLHGALHFVFDPTRRPKMAVHQLRRFVVAPSLCIFVAAFLLSALVRYVSGNTLLLLLPAFSLSLWFGTVSMVLLAAGLCTVGFLYGWSARSSKSYHRLDDEMRSSKEFLDELQKKADEPPVGEDVADDRHGSSGSSPRNGDRLHVTKALAVADEMRSSKEFLDELQKKADEPPVSEDVADGRHGSDGSAPRDGDRSHITKALAIGIVLSSALSLTLTNCSSQSSAPSPPARAEISRATFSDGPLLLIVIDCTHSPESGPIQQAWSLVRDELPSIIETNHVSRLDVLGFDGDGWSLSPLENLTLPSYTEQPEEHAKSEIDKWRNVLAAREKEEQSRSERAQALYTKQLLRALQPVIAMSYPPEAAREPKNSDVVGLLRRIAYEAGAQKAICIVISDFLDTYHRPLPHIQPPHAPSVVLALIVPSKPKDVLQALGTNLSGAQQFALHVKELREAVPWVIPAPYFARNLATLVDSP